MRERDLDRLRLALEDFTAEVLSGLSRADQRATAGTYLRGLMLDGKRKSMQPMAARLKVDHQRLQQFVTYSTWDYTPVRRKLAGMIIDVVQPDAWGVDDTGFIKDGTSSPCVARQYTGTLGKAGNCQVAVSIHAATDAASGVLGWRLFLPESWDDEAAMVAGDDAAAEEARAARTQRRARARIPEGEHHRPKWQLALAIIDEAIGWGHRPPVLVADAGYGDITAFGTGLDDRAIPYVLALRPIASAYPGDAIPVTAPAPAGPPGPAPAWFSPDPAYPNSAAFSLLSGRSTSNPSIASSRHDRRNAPRAVPSAANGVAGPASPAPGPQQRSNTSAKTLRSKRFRACVIALEVGTLQAASQQPNRSNDPVTFRGDLFVVVIGEQRQPQSQIRRHVRRQLPVRTFLTGPARRDRSIDLFPGDLRDQHPERDLIGAHNRTIRHIHRHGPDQNSPAGQTSARHAEPPRSTYVTRH